MSGPSSPGAGDPARLAALRATGLLDTPPEEVFDRLARLAAAALGTPVGLVTLVDQERQFFKSCVGLAEPWATRRETPLSHSFCRHAVESEAPLLVGDAREDPRFRGSPALPDLGVVAYAGVPLVTSEGHALGTLCVMDALPRRWGERDVAVLSDLASSAVTEIELRTLLRRRETEHGEELRAERLSALDQLATGLRHEVNNALAGLLLSAGLVADQPGLPEEARGPAGAVIDQALRIRDVLERLEDVASLPTTPYPRRGPMIDLSGREE